MPRRRTKQLTAKQQELLHYKLTPLLSAEETLVLSPSRGYISLIHSPVNQPYNVIQGQLGVSATLALQLLIEYLPSWCPYNVLIPRFVGGRSPNDPSETTSAHWRDTVRPIRHAMGDLHAALAPFDLGVAVFPRIGYKLVRRSELYLITGSPSESVTDTPPRRVVSFYAVDTNLSDSEL